MNDHTLKFEPLADTQDYENALDRLNDIEETGDCDCGPEAEEAELLTAMLEEFETREGIEEDDFETHTRFAPEPPVRLVEFALSNGNRVEFLAPQDMSELYVGEIGCCGSEDMILDDTIPPVEVFRRFAPAELEVPGLIARADASGRLATRRMVETLSDPVQVDLPALGIHTPEAAPAGSCQQGAAGAAYFDAHHCGQQGGPGYGKRETYCYKNSYNWIQKTSKRRMRTTYSRMAACGSGNSRVRHFYRKVSGWHTQLNITVSAGNLATYWTAKTGIKRYRRVRFEEISDSAWVRGWVVYHDRVAGGWF